MYWAMSLLHCSLSFMQIISAGESERQVRMQGSGSMLCIASTACNIRRAAFYDGLLSVGGPPAASCNGVSPAWQGTAA